MLPGGSFFINVYLNEQINCLKRGRLCFRKIYQRFLLNSERECADDIAV